IGPAVCAEKIAEHHRGDAEGGVQRLLRNGKIDTIQIIHQDAEAEQQRDSPAPPRRPGHRRCGFRDHHFLEFVSAIWARMHANPNAHLTPCRAFQRAKKAYANGARVVVARSRYFPPSRKIVFWKTSLTDGASAPQYEAAAENRLFRRRDDAQAL